MDLAGKCAVVTGASRGIGAALSAALVGRGVRVVGIARDLATLRLLSDRYGEAFLPLSCDVRDLEQVRRAVRMASEQMASVDILINNAGVGHFADADQLDKGLWDDLFATNVSGTYYCIREIVPIMKARGGGHIINIASMAGLVGHPGASGYCATKFAIRGLSEALLKELSRFGIKVTVVCPGSTDTTFGGRQSGTNTRSMRPEELADVVVHILERPDNMLISELVMRPFPGAG